MLILLLAAGLRLGQLDTVMPEMTSDHVEKIRDAWRVSRGELNVFFANNGGREPLQMYAMALLAQLPGLDFNFYTLKLLSALEGIVAVLLLYWTGCALIGGREGRLVGLLVGALVAVGYWHILLSRLGLRIVLTTGVAALLLLFLWRALRHQSSRRLSRCRPGYGPWALHLPGNAHVAAGRADGRGTDPAFAR